MSVYVSLFVAKEKRREEEKGRFVNRRTKVRESIQGRSKGGGGLLLSIPLLSF
jgi:hypothetical protein